MKHLSLIRVHGQFNPLHYAWIGVNLWRLKYFIKRVETLLSFMGSDVFNKTGRTAATHFGLQCA
jgi:hypothetical protein